MKCEMVNIGDSMEQTIHNIHMCHKEAMILTGNTLCPRSHNNNPRCRDTCLAPPGRDPRHTCTRAAGESSR